MKRLIFGGISVLLLSAATAPAVRAELKILGTPSYPAVNPAADPGSRLAPGTPGAPTTSGHRTRLQKTPLADSKRLQETPVTGSRCIGILGTPSNPAADPSSRLAPDASSVPYLSQ